MNKNTTRTKVSARTQKIARIAGKVIGITALIVFGLAVAIAAVFLLSLILGVLLASVTGGAYTPTIGQSFDLLLLTWIAVLIVKLGWK